MALKRLDIFVRYVEMLVLDAQEICQISPVRFPALAQV